MAVLLFSRTKDDSAWKDKHYTTSFARDYLKEPTV